MERCGGCHNVIWPWQRIEWHNIRSLNKSLPFHVKKFCWNSFPWFVKR